MTVTSDWAELLEQARAERKNLWQDIMQDVGEKDPDLPENIEEIGALYIDLKIDFARAKQAIDAGGDLSVIEIDPRPEDAPEGEITVLNSYFAHFRKVVDETLKANNLTELDLSSKEHSDMFTETEIRLFETGQSINPLL
jgi:hypothetical protein